MSKDFNWESEDESLLDLLDEPTTNITQEEDDQLLDLLDLEDESLPEIISSNVSEGSNDSSVPIYTQDYGDHSFQSIAIDFDIDPEEDARLFAFDEEIEDEDDLEIINGLRNELTQLNYKHLELYDYDYLNKLKELHNNFINEDIMVAQQQLLSQMFSDVKNGIQSSKATLNKTLSSIRIDESIMPKPDGNIDNDFAVFVWETICRCINEKKDSKNLHEEITVNYIVTKLVHNNIPEKYSYCIDDSSFFRFLEEAIPVAISAFMHSYQNIKSAEMQREKVTSYLLKAEQEAISSIENAKCSFIAQAFRDVDKYYYYCQGCDKLMELSGDIVSYILYESEQENFQDAIIPRLIKCPECGKEHLFSLSWYLDIKKHLQQSYKKGTDEIFKYLSKVSSGTAITRILPSMSTIMDGINLVVDFENNVQETNTKLENQSVAEPTLFADDEYKEAIDNFNKRLLLFDSTKITKSIATVEDSLEEDFDTVSFTNVDETSTSNYISAKELAKCITSELALNYQIIKNKALYSLIMVFNEYSFISDILDRKNYWELENRLTFLQKLDMITNNDKEYISLLHVLYKDIVRDSSNGAVDFDTLVHELKNYRNNIKEHLRQMDDAYDKLLNNLKTNFDLLAHTRILNINQSNYFMLTGYLNDSSLASIIDNLTDQMIINNYAEQYAHVLFKSSVLNNSNLKNSLISLADGQRIRATVCDYFYKQYDYIISGSLQARLEFVSANHLAPLKNAADALKNYEYYNFIEALSTIKNYNTLISLEADKQLKALVELARDEKAKMGTHSEYYLRDFDKTEIDSLEPASRATLMYISFGRFVPKRLVGESLADYLVRYKQLEESNHLSIVEHYDYAMNFKKFEQFFLVVIAGYNVLDLECDNFALANFIRCWLLLCRTDFDRTKGLMLLGYSEEYIRRLNALCTYSFSINDFTGVTKLMKLVTGRYVTPVQVIMSRYYDELEKITLNERFDFTKFLYVNAEQILNELENLSEEDIAKLQQVYISNKADTSDDKTVSSLDENEYTKEELVNEAEAYIGS